MPNLLIFESLVDKEIFGGYSLSSFDWWVDFIVLGIAALIVGGIYFCLEWGFGRLQFKEDDKEKLDGYRKADRKEKKAINQKRISLFILLSFFCWHVNEWPIGASVCMVE